MVQGVEVSAAEQVVCEYHTDKGIQHVIVQEGRGCLRVTMMDGGVKFRRLPLTERAYMTETSINVNKAKRSFRSRGRTFGISKAAKRALRGNS